MDISIDDVINHDLVILDLQTTDRDEAIREMAQRLEADGRLKDVEAYVDAVLAREAEGTTGMGMGIAIPHGKSEAVTRTGIVFARSDAGVDFASDEGTPSHLLFLIAAPEGTGDLHVTLLAKLARKLIHEEFRSNLQHATSPDQVIDLLRQEVAL